WPPCSSGRYQRRPGLWDSPCGVRLLSAPLEQSRARARWRPVLAAATALSGLLSLASAITPGVPWRESLLDTVEPGSAIALGHVLAAAAGIAQLVLAWGLLRGKRRAVSATIAILCAAAFVHLAKGLDYEESAVALGLAALLYLN